MKYIDKQPTREAISALRNYFQAKKEKVDWYDNTFDKAAVKTSLVIEQGYLCAYCMQRIEDDHTTKLEHWEDQASLKKLKEKGEKEKLTKKEEKEKLENLSKIFDYDNIFAVCKGSLHDNKGKQQHCDSSRSKGNRELTLKPSDKRTLQNVKYSSNGRIYAACAITNMEIEEDNMCPQFDEKKGITFCNLQKKCAQCDLTCEKGLNLNLLTLMDNRKKVLNDLKKELAIFCNSKDFEKNEIVKKKIVAKYVGRNKELKYRPYCGIIEFFYKKYL